MTGKTPSETHAPAFLEAEKRLLDMFMGGDISANAPLRESVLAKRFGLTRPAMREALSQAVGWGIVEYVSFCGFRIRDFTLEDLRDWMELRDAVESTAARRLALERPDKPLKDLRRMLEQAEEAFRDGKHALFNQLDCDFHLEIIRASGNRKFTSPAILCYTAVLLSGYHQHEMVNMDIELGTDELDPFAPRCDTCEEYLVYNEGQCCIRHKDILLSIYRGDPDSAERLVHAHVRMPIQRIQRAIAHFGATTHMSELVAKFSKD
jgi:DNA-binding GntR family transcriptional regulator